MSIWSGKHAEISKPWGKECTWGSPFGVSGKLIHMNKNTRNSLKYYEHRNQVLYCLAGNVRIHAIKENEFGQKCCESTGAYFDLSSGEYILIQCKNPYRVEAKEDSVLVEVMDGKSMNNVATILEDDYGRTTC